MRRHDAMTAVLTIVVGLALIAIGVWMTVDAGHFGTFGASVGAALNVVGGVLLSWAASSTLSRKQAISGRRFHV